MVSSDFIGQYFRYAGELLQLSGPLYNPDQWSQLTVVNVVSQQKSDEALTGD